KKEVKPVWISNTFSRQLTHKWRAEEQAIMVGTNTVLQDNPKLDVRNWTGENPIRIVIDKTLKIPSDFSVYDKSVKTIFITEKKQLSTHENLLFETIDFNKNVCIEILKALYKHQIQSVIIEGGKILLESFIQNNLWDEARIFTSDLVFENGIKAPEFNTSSKPKAYKILNDTLKYIYNEV